MPGAQPAIAVTTGEPAGIGPEICAALDAADCRGARLALIGDALSRTTFTLGSGREFVSTNDLLSAWPPLVAGKTGHTAGAGWSEAAAARGNGATVYGSVLGGSTRESRNAALKSLLRHGIASYRRVAAVDS